MSDSYIEIYKGDTSSIVYVRPGLLLPGDPIDANWFCNIAASDGSGNNVISKREITDKANVSIKNEDGSVSVEECFMCFLLPSETALLTPGNDSIWGIQIENITTLPVFTKEKQILLKVSPEVVK